MIEQERAQQVAREFVTVFAQTLTEMLAEAGIVTDVRIGMHEGRFIVEFGDVTIMKEHGAKIEAISQEAIRKVITTFRPTCTTVLH